jgi:acyl-CoA reductase-like NAD-dependent aldehyde dehydrogenase
MSYTLINPATGEEMETIEHATVDETDHAIERARVAQKEWASFTPAERGEALRRFARAVENDVETLAALEVRNSGHPISQARWEANHVRNVLDYYSAAPERLLGKQIPVAGGIDITFNEPIGVVGIITPWNFPMTIASWGFAPALAAGNAVVLKPAEWTPLTSIRLGELGATAGLPDGLFQVIAGRGSVVGNRFLTNDKVGKVVFTGSTEVGKGIMRGAADQIKRVTLELGGKSANIVFADADVDKAAATAPYSVFENAG